MGTVETKIVVSVAAELLKMFINNEPDAKPTIITEKIIKAKNKEEIKAAIVDELVGAVIFNGALPPETEDMIEKLVIANNEDDIEDIIERPEVQKGIIGSILSLIGSIGKLLTGK
jgi:hypothetical protein